MKNTITLLLIILSTTILGQDFDKLYYNEMWNITSMDKATYYRISGFNDTIPAFDGKVTDYYAETNQVQMEGVYKDGIRNGVFRFYDPAGTTRLIMEFKDGERAGEWKEFYPNGKLRLALNYIEGKELVIELNDENGNSILEGKKIEYSVKKSELHNFFSSTQEDQYELLYMGVLKNGLRHGKWTIDKNQKKYVTLKYDEGEFLEGSMLVGNREYPFDNDRAFSFISDPGKLEITESYVFERGARIKENFFTAGLANFRQMNAPKVVINSREELESFIKNNFDIRSRKTESMMKIEITVVDGKPTDCITKPKISEKSLNKLKSILQTVDTLNFDVQNTITIDYKIEKIEL
ncbi:toxin-antitoxin system YwqK family antitoxin [Luteibaculum oceani]|uniref:Toxin-antitoxin system YwqK family antitoxin n=1 Tax=Luteibaculum oceani TaxID=1294296 RepID=A0A5C6VA56_9FLAO|nr:hypothetical protein [Luteibaculum oceani]TXC82089.1 hypothetical protein FRX97_03070 [Luteibaculum oceani]